MPEKKDGLFDIGEIRQILELMKEFNVSHFNLSQSGQRLSLRRAGFAEPPVVAAPSVVAGPVQPAVANVVAPSPEASEKEPDYIKTVKSPMVGVFYAAPAENADPFVTAGTEISEGDTVGIIEAMKLMNEVRSECSGTVQEICVANGQVVEYGTELFRIRR